VKVEVEIVVELVELVRHFWEFTFWRNLTFLLDRLLLEDTR
jgi:hypothetical protein